MIYIQTCLATILEIFCCKMFFETFSQKRETVKFWGRFFLLGLMIVSYIVIVVCFDRQFLIKEILILLIMGSVMRCYFQIGRIKTVVLAVLYQGLMLVVDYVAYSIQGAILQGNEIFAENGIMITIFARSILFLCVLIIRRHFGKRQDVLMSDTQWIKFLFFPIFTIVIIAAMISQFSYEGNENQLNVMFIIAVGMAGLNIGYFYLIDDILKREQNLHEKEMLYLQAKNMMGMYEKISENFEIQRKKTHEYKNHMLCIEALLKEKKYEKLENYITGMFGELDKKIDVINTNHVIINAIVNTKYQEALENGIVFVFKVNDLSNIAMQDEDIVVVLSNLLNNAMEACMKCKEKRIIKLKLIQEEKELIIAVKNTYEDAILLENGEIRTTKLDKNAEHGIGIKNIVRIVEKYKGSYVLNYAGKEFLFSIMIPNSAKKSRFLQEQL